MAWISAQQDHMQRLPRAGEDRISLLQKDLDICQVESVISRLSDREALNVRFRDIPMKELRASLFTLSSSTAQVNYVYSVGLVYDPLLRTLSKTNMGEAFNAIVFDLRSICAYNSLVL
ncbi:unnamed protein product [Dibothriocephalus latus]|uniref:Uncharacterized protein n=1 Tax=Dibothriocephalus latus TaxID=60516 RepID=A0A3P7LQ43_DIBLA|nr:unnamed protein product [Dibothriocephalus latus]